MFQLNLKIKCKRKINNGEGSNNSTTQPKQINLPEKLIIKILQWLVLIDFLCQFLIPHLKELFFQMLS
jgi:hypothetical protein